MPELPEVETVVRQLRPHLEGRVITGVEIRDAKLAWPEGAPAQLRGRRVARVWRHGKQIALELAPQSFGSGEVDKESKATPGAAEEVGEALVLLVHLRMTGRLIYCPGEIPTGTQHLRAVVRLDAGWLVFQDTRRFGTMALLAAEELPAPTGLDPMGKAFTAAALKRLLAGTRTPIKVWLLRQDRLVGMGNIYASESLFLAGIHPERAGGTLNDGEIARLRGAIRRVLQRSIQAGGTTFSDFRDANGLMGNYARELRVYGHAGEACPACRGVIERVAQGQRSTFFCPQCQPAEPRGGF